MSEKRVSLVLLTVVLALALPPCASAQEGPTPVKVEFTIYEGNPILSKSDAGEWDAGFVFGGGVIYHEGLFHMFYSGGDGAWETSIPSIGYATSRDGLHWTKYAKNPVLTPDESVTPYGIHFACPIMYGDAWVLFIAPRTGPGERDHIHRATAPAPTGPWTVEPVPVLKAGDVLEWDTLGVALMSALHTDTEYVLTYWNQGGYGRATSSDGITWTKYNDPETTQPRFANSDPIFTVGTGAVWDSGLIFPIVYARDQGWDMFYMANKYGAAHIRAMGYASSPDGIHWTRFGDGPILAFGDSYQDTVPDSAVLLDDVYYVYQSIVWGTPTENAWAIGVSTGTIAWDE